MGQYRIIKAEKIGDKQYRLYQPIRVRGNDSVGYLIVNITMLGDGKLPEYGYQFKCYGRFIDSKHLRFLDCKWDDVKMRFYKLVLVDKFES